MEIEFVNFFYTLTIRALHRLPGIPKPLRLICLESAESEAGYVARVLVLPLIEITRSLLLFFLEIVIQGSLFLDCVLTLVVVLCRPHRKDKRNLQDL